jgi:hypothetical protein
LRGPLPYAEIGAAFQTGAIFLSMSRTGSMDKAILEAMASGCIPISDNDAFATIARAAVGIISSPIRASTVWCGACAESWRCLKPSE